MKRPQVQFQTLFLRINNKYLRDLQEASFGKPRVHGHQRIHRSVLLQARLLRRQHRYPPDLQEPVPHEHHRTKSHGKILDTNRPATSSRSTMAKPLNRNLKYCRLVMKAKMSLRIMTCSDTISWCLDKGRTLFKFFI